MNLEIETSEQLVIAGIIFVQMKPAEFLRHRYMVSQECTVADLAWGTISPLIQMHLTEPENTGIETHFTKYGARFGESLQSEDIHAHTTYGVFNADTCRAGVLTTSGNRHSTISF